MYVCGKNRENRLLQSKNSSSKSFVPVKFGNVSDAKFGPAHSVILKGNGQVLTSTANKKIEMDFFGAKESKLKGTIHLRRQQIFTIFDPYPPSVDNFLLLSVARFGKF